jgi:hypothetical protein
MERKDVFENELTEEDLPSGAKREDEAETERLDPDVDSQDADEFIEDDEEGP